MTDTAYEQQQAIQSRRRAQRRVKGWAHVSCPRPKCPVGNLFAEVDEGGDGLPFQAPLNCVRCGSILIGEAWRRD
jgi:hypothetical protein